MINLEVAAVEADMFVGMELTDAIAEREKDAF